MSPLPSSKCPATGEHWPGYLVHRILPDGRHANVVVGVSSNADIVTGPACVQQEIDDRWTYETVRAAVEALGTWSGEGDPPGRWIRHKPSDRRRRYTDETYLEWVAP